MFDRILVPLDGTEFAEQALPFAIALLRRSGGSLSLATVEVPPPIAFPDVNFIQPLSEAEQRYLDAVADQARDAGLGDVSVAVLTGNAPEVLEAHRAEIGASLTVMATHGRGPLSRAWMGSVADRFVRTTAAPVLFVRPPDDGGRPDFARIPEPGHVAVTLDGSELSETALDPAVALADLFDADLSLVRVVEYPHSTESVYLPDAVEAIQQQLDQSREAAHAELERVASRMVAEGTEVGRESRVVNHAAAGILDAVDEIGAELVVMASRGRGGLGRVVLGSVADKVLRASKRPVLIVPA
ncbi:MAG: universal stress protein [Gemmatimonadetes bacterium]|nr:universal stress protein [Gemmatimonadota bacterium]